MDSLVEHIHEDHIGHRQKKYACEWDDCTRKSTPHASGYALRAHMRSHTKEKPFFCQLPECDRSFTRSDALAKHMRTVHETEALRPSDPVPRNHSNPPPRPQRIKLILSARPPAERPDGDGDDVEADLDDDETTILSPDDYEVGLRSTNASDPYPSDLHLTDEEKAMPPSKLLALLKFQMECVEEERVQLLDDVAGLEKLKFREWQNKELLLENVMEAELAFHEQRAARKRAGSTKQGEFATMKILPEKNLPLTGDLPWWRTTASKPGEETEGFRTLDPEEAIS
ncbi:MAG: hypothetical protein M1832_005191 [Thelocarpon impressellum]|nr:MAG: hypothetical protein M1832_005191 [Thelocarpon impressellum]